MPPADLAARFFAGLADLAFAPRDNRTLLVRSLTRPPLTVGRTLYPDEALRDLAHLILANPTAGIFAGDRLTIRVRVEDGDRVHLTTQAATRLHPVPRQPANDYHSPRAATQRVRLRVASGAALEWLSEPPISFRGAGFSQATTLTVTPGGTLIYSDVIAPVRVAMGDRWPTRDCKADSACRRPPVNLSTGKLSRCCRGHILRSIARCSDRRPRPSAPSSSSPTRWRRKRSEIAYERASGGRHDAVGCGGVCVKALGESTQQVEWLLRATWGVARRTLWGVGLPPTQVLEHYC